MDVRKKQAIYYMQTTEEVFYFPTYSISPNLKQQF